MGVRLATANDPANRSLEDMTWDEKRALVQMVFSGKTPEPGQQGQCVSLRVRGSWRAQT